MVRVDQHGLLPYQDAGSEVRNETVGLAKVVVMASRLNLFWGMTWTAIPEYLTAESETANFDVLIGCVDTRAVRGVIHDRVRGSRSRVAYWLDIGNLADSGQFVLGQP